MSEKKKPKMKCVKVWLPNQLNKAAKREAKSFGQSKSAYIREMVETNVCY
jgi:predicted DNA-binding protein